MVSHEMRTPFTLIQQFCSILCKDLMDSKYVGHEKITFADGNVIKVPVVRNLN